MTDKITSMSAKKWFWVALLAVLLVAPNTTVIRIAVNDADPFYWVLSRFLLVALVCLPFFITARKSIMHTSARKPLIIASIAMSISIVAYTYAIYVSQASYVSIVTLISPIIFVALSSKLTGDKFTRRSVAGLSLAAAGAVALVVLPAALSQDGVAFYPLATLLALTDGFLYSIATIYLRKANEAGVSMPGGIGVMAIAIAALAAVLFALFGDWSRTPVDGGYIGAVLYSGLVVGLLARALRVFSYEHIGAYVMSALGYLATLIAIMIPVVVLDEKLSPEMTIGAILILLGVYVVEHHKHPHVKHHYIHWHH